MSLKTSAKTPNAEQQIAIDHRGGKILSAGAGSGKTFVLIEHIITWLDNLRIKTPSSEWPHVVPFQLPKLVLMTFTKKAAGEMSIRMMKRIDDLCDGAQTEKDLEYWSLIRQYLSMMNITTISSFCHKLLSQGYFSDVGSEIQILSNVEFKNKISNLFNLWFISKQNRLNQVFEANSNALIGAMIEIYSSPELRLLWKEPLVKTSPERELEDYTQGLLATLSLPESVDLSADAKEKEKGWYVLLQGFDQLLSTHGRLSGSTFRAYAQWATSVGTLPRSVKAMNESQVEDLEKIKGLVKELREVSEDFLNFIDHYETYWSWVEVFKDVYHFIDEHYFLEKGMAFADLEYYACIGLRNPQVREKIKKNYDYFIVDEFQDTSSVQYEIINHLVGDNHQRLFCVGDKKQAIYGFRGGEILVFNQCSEMLGTENNIWLKNNFRSFGKIISFNNHFFEAIFPLGHGFEGEDANTVVMEPQTIPETKNDLGEVERFKTEVIGLETDKGLDLDLYEAQGLFNVTQELLAREDIQVVSVLYRKLAPSALLLEMLSQHEIPFSAQVKIQYAEDPVINLFLRAIELKLNFNHPVKKASTHFLLKTLLEVLNVEISTQQVEEKFLGDLSVLGLRLAFHKLIYSLGLSNSQYQENSALIDSICRVCNEDPVRVFHLLSTESEEQYSLELISGGRGKRVIIMSAHASKGLEFDAVLLGGIHSNGLQMGKTETVGKLPKSFRWKKAYNQKKFYKSPVYYYEAELDRMKEFSESKRLLYVACTRAIKYLGWVDLWSNIDGKEKELSSGANHWIRAMRLAPAMGTLSERAMTLSKTAAHQNTETPIVLKDALGLNALKTQGRLGIFAETSVTRLAQLAQCPFKFYLANICKIPAPGMDPQLFISPEEEDSGETFFFSSKERGTRVHAYLSKLLLGEIAVTDIPLDEKDKIEWTQKEAEKVSGQKNIISEKQIKFSLFGQMVSGTPDLVFENEESVVIWDFKTGQEDKAVEESYWFQLMCYGYAYANLKHFTPEKMIPLSLVYIDQKKIVTRAMTLLQITQILFENWTKTESLYQVNLSHCTSCDYSSICIHYKRTAQS